MPLTEAFYKRLPVVAYAATAVPATMDGAGVLYEDRAPVHVAAVIDAGAGRCGAVRAGRRVTGRRARPSARPRLRWHAAALRGAGAKRRRAKAQPEVSFDFWDQFDTYERLKELQQYRPAVFRALPFRNSECGMRNSG